MRTQTKLSAKGQCVIPRAVRERMGWRAGDALEVVEGRDSVTLVRQSDKSALGPPITWAEFRALVPPHDGPPIPEEEWEPAIGRMFAENPKWR